MSFLTFEEGVAPRGWITKVWRITSTSSPNLGEVRWMAHWRRYVFCPSIDTLFDVTCLREIADFIERQMEARKINE